MSVYVRLPNPLFFSGVATGQRGRHWGAQARPPFCRSGRTFAVQALTMHSVHGDARQCRPGPADMDHKHSSATSPADSPPIVLVFFDDWQQLAILPVSVFESLLAIHR
jgi:hypothetical protein